MAYGQLIRRAWETTWRNKALWVFGFLAVICAGAYPGTGRPVSALQYVIGGRDLSKWADVFPFASAGRIDWRAFATLLAALAGVAFVASLVGAVVRMIVRYTAEGALICGVDAAERAEPARLDAMLRGGWARTFGLLLLDLLIRIVSALALLPTIVILLAGLALTIGSAVALGISSASGAGTAAVALGPWCASRRQCSYASRSAASRRFFASTRSAPSRSRGAASSRRWAMPGASPAARCGTPQPCGSFSALSGWRLASF